MTKPIDKEEREATQLKDLDEGVGYSSDKILARRYATTRKTIWTWAGDPENPFPQPKKISANITRWMNSEIKEHEEKHFKGASQWP
jgi:predicted DNA-binding transcriptional regulator AlpA